MANLLLPFPTGFIFIFIFIFYFLGLVLADGTDNE